MRRSADAPSCTACGMGVGIALAVPDPSWASTLLPQHHTRPAVARTQVCASPTTTSTASVMSGTITGARAHGTIVPLTSHWLGDASTPS